LTGFAFGTYNEANYTDERTGLPAKPGAIRVGMIKMASDIDKIEKRLDMLDNRLDNIDSIVSAVTERVMKQPITFNVTCSRCGHKIEIAIIGTEKPTK
jgi:hypothetical protein